MSQELKTTKRQPFVSFESSDLTFSLHGYTTDIGRENPNPTFTKPQVVISYRVYSLPCTVGIRNVGLGSR